MGQAGGRHERAVGDPHAVMDLVALLEAAEDRDRVLHRRLFHVDRLEAPLERRVLLDVLLVLVEGRRADGPQLPARERRLEHVGGVHGPLGGAGADERVQLVDEEDDRPLRLLDLLEDGLQAVLELAPVFRPGDHRAQVERDDALVLQPFGHVAHVDAAREPLDDGGLAHARIPDEDRVVLGAPGEDLDHAADLLVPADDRVDLAAPREVRQVAGVFLERLVLVFGILVGHARGAADFLEGAQEDVLLRPGGREALRRFSGVGFGEREQEVLRRDVFVPELACDLEGPIECLVQLTGEGSVRGSARDAGQAVQRLLDFRRESRSR